MLMLADPWGRPVRAKRGYRKEARSWLATLLVLGIFVGNWAHGQQAPAGVPAKPAGAPDAQSPASQAGQTSPAGRGGGVAGTLPTGGENQLFMELQVGTNYTTVTPDLRGPDGRPVRSFLTPGSNTVANLTYFQDHNWGSDRRVAVLGIFRNTNDVRVDPEQNSFQRGYIRLTTPGWELNFGDYLVNYSRFTYNQNIKGIHVVRKFSEGFKVLANGGVFTDRWGSIFKDSLLGKPFTRVVAGLRAEERFSKDKVVGWNFSHGRDQVESIRENLRSGFLGTENQIVSVDTRLSFGRLLSLDGELAYSRTNPDTVNLKDARKDWGGRLDTSLRKGRFYVRTSYTRLMPSFLSLNARQLADLQDGSVKAGAELGPHVTVEGTYRHTNNDLRGDRTEGSTIFRVPEGRVSLRQLPHLGRSIWDVGYRERRQAGPFRATINDREDRLTRIPFVEMQLPFGATLISGTFEHRQNLDRRQPSQNTATNSYSVSLRSTVDVGGWQIMPSLRYQMEREVFFRVLGANDNRSMQGLLSVEAPKYFVLELMYRQVGATLFSECLTSKTETCSQFAGIPENLTVLLPGGFGRPSYRGALTYKIHNNENTTVIFSVERNNNFFALADRNFRERIIAVTVLYRFKR